MSLLVYVPGDPVPKARARVVGGRGVTPAKTREYEHRVGVYALQARSEHQQSKPWSMLGWYRVEIRFRREEARGDLDNVAKSILDGLCGVLYLDDARVVSLVVERLYEGQVGAWVTVTEVPAPGGSPAPRKRPAARAPKADHPWRGRAALPAKGYRGGA
jgi:Holliday junction resolvase RusA-like endonuclease